MGGVKKIFKSVGKMFGMNSTSVAEVPDYEAERRKAEDEAVRKRSQLVNKGMSGTILGGSYGDDANLKKKKLLGE